MGSFPRADQIVDEGPINRIVPASEPGRLAQVRRAPAQVRRARSAPLASRFRQGVGLARSGAQARSARRLEERPRSRSRWAWARESALHTRRRRRS